ncbi:hypothetical protein [Nakamurella endophytica]|uniref:Uncharacterized protein n=1 Tax=Nakamurella endophytica TaxID=1748367 RepID=A0A917T498_9ACTN|nr:hypothetical protein [Nakamurella endophytica]GGM08788.1 hypothetical protein GCM10011594_30870 [Nakamurella endophytica]
MTALDDDVRTGDRIRPAGGTVGGTAGGTVGGTADDTVGAALGGGAHARLDGAAHPDTSALAGDLEFAHRLGVGAAVAGIQDPALETSRLAGPPAAVEAVAEAAVSSATPFLRAPLLSRIAHALLLHDGTGGRCRTCDVPAPCPTARELTR